MSDFIIAPAARSDLDEIWEYYAIEVKNPDAADRIIDDVFKGFHKLAETPGMGHFRSDLAAEPLRFWRVRSYSRGWDQLRTEDCGVLWEHLVLDTLIAARLPKIHFWRDKQQREVDFVVPRERDTADAIECKWNPQAFESRGLAAFRQQYPKGKNFVVSPLTSPSYERVQDGLKISFVSPGELRLAMA